MQEKVYMKRIKDIDELCTYRDSFGQNGSVHYW